MSITHIVYLRTFFAMFEKRHTANHSTKSHCITTLTQHKHSVTSASRICVLDRDILRRDSKFNASVVPPRLDGNSIVTPTVVIVLCGHANKKNEICCKGYAAVQSCCTQSLSAKAITHISSRNHLCEERCGCFWCKHFIFGQVNHSTQSKWKCPTFQRPSRSRVRDAYLVEKAL